MARWRQKTQVQSCPFVHCEILSSRTGGNLNRNCLVFALTAGSLSQRYSTCRPRLVNSSSKPSISSAEQPKGGGTLETHRIRCVNFVTRHVKLTCQLTRSVSCQIEVHAAGLMRHVSWSIIWRNASRIDAKQPKIAFGVCERVGILHACRQPAGEQGHDQRCVSETHSFLTVSWYTYVGFCRWQDVVWVSAFEEGRIVRLWKWMRWVLRCSALSWEQ